MLKNAIKRCLSCLLAVVMIVTTLCAADPSGWFPTADAAIAPGNDALPDVYIVVPETFYMTPSLTASTSVQFYINNTVSGTTITPDEARDAASGKIWFNVSSGTVTDLEYTILGTNKTHVQMSAGSGAETLTGVTLNSGMTAAQVRTLEWVFTCAVNGIPAEYHAYSVAYAPYYAPVGAAANAKNGNAGTQMQGIAWVSGVHGYTDCEPATAASSDKDNYVLGNYHARTVWDGEWNRPLVPLISAVPTPTNNDENIWDWLATTDVGACSDATFTLYDVDKSASGWGAKSLDIATQSHIAEMTVDVSRNHSFTTVPNVTTGFFVSDLKRDSKYMGSYGGYAANYAGDVPGIDFWFSQNHYGSGGGSFAATEGVDTVFFGGNPDAGTGTREFNTDGIPYNGLWNRATPTATGTSMHYIHTAMCCEFENNWIYINLYLCVNVHAVDKTALRSKVFEKQAQANAKAIDNYAAVREKLEAAYLALGDPTATQAAIDSAAADLDNVDALLYSSAEITAQHIDQQTGEPFSGGAAEQLTVRRSDDSVTVLPNSYTGYTYTGMRRTHGATAAFGLFDANAWAQSACAAGGSGVSSVEYDAPSRTITVHNTDTETGTGYPTSGNLLSSGYACIPVDPTVTYTLDFDYASASRGKVGVICYDRSGGYIGSMQLFDSFKATGGTSVFRHCTETICPQANPYLFGNARRYETHYIVLTFGISAEGSQSADTAVFSNVSVTPNETLFDLAQWNCGTASFRSGTNATGISAKSYDSETKTLSLTSAAADSCTSYTTGNVLTANETSGSTIYPWHYIPVEPGATYSIEGAYAGTGNGQIAILHYNLNGTFIGATCLAASAAQGGILAATGSDSNFDPFYSTLTVGEQDSYIALAFGGKGNTYASADDPVSNVFRDVKLYASSGADTTYTLYYRPNRYTVRFNTNGGIGTMPDQLFTYSVAQDLTANTFTCPGCSFDGWATTPGGVKVYEDGESVSSLTSVSDGVVDLYACWAADAYTIRYNEAGGTISGNCVTDYDINTSFMLPNAEKDGYTLSGWRADGSGNWGPMTYSLTTAVSGKYGDVLLTAVWKANNYSVAFNPNGGTGTAMANQSFVYGTPQALTANAFSRYGYKFLGWALTDDATDAAYPDKAQVQDLTPGANDIVTLYAVWGANSYSIVYSTDTGTIRDAEYTTNYTILDRIELPVTVEKTGYTFTGWKPAASSGSWSTETIYTGTLNSGMAGNVTLQTQWSLQGYTIRYELDGGTFSNNKYTTGYNITTSPITLPPARKTGYVFDGWKANNVGNWGDSIYQSGTVSAGHYGDVTLTAQWTGVRYYVQFNGNGSTDGLMFNQSFTYGESGTLDLNEYVRGGYQFVGWATSSAATSAAYADGASVLNLSPTAGAIVTLYAVWEKSAYTITYDGNGGTISVPGTTTFTITDTITLPVVRRSGYTAQGWRPQQNNGSWHTWDVYIDSIAYGCYGNVTLVAQWQKDTYTITYDSQGGTLSIGYTTEYDVDTQIVLPTVTRTGYIFCGWQASAAWNYVTITDGNAPAGACGDVTLTALWRQKTYYIRFNANGGAGTMNDQLMAFDVSQALSRNAFTRLGYNFGGWATSETGQKIYADGDTVLNLSQTDGAIVYLYAVWEARNFSIVYDLNGASGSLSNTNVVMDGAAVTLRAYNVAETPINDLPYTFAGWAYSPADADSGVAAYGNKAAFSLNEAVLELAEVDWTPAKPTITLYAVWMPSEVKLIVPEDAATIIDTEKKYIYGIKDNITRSDLTDLFLGVSGNGRIEIVTPGAVGTGTVVQLVSNFDNRVLETYRIVIFGDANGDGLINTTDVTTVRMMNAGMYNAEPDDIYLFAADVHADGDINLTDVTDLRMIQAGMSRYDQAARTIVMI